MDLIHSYTTRIINLSDVDFIFNNIIKITGDKSYVLVTPDNEVDFTTNRSYDNFLTIKYQYLNLSGNTKSTLENPGGNQCPNPCPIAFYNMSCYNGLPGDPVYCAGGGCATAMQAQTLIDENAMSTDSVYMAYDTSFQYSYRDDFLMNSTVIMLFSCSSFGQLEGSYKSAEYSYIEKSLSYLSGIESFVGGMELTLSSDSSFYLKTCSVIETGKWSIINDSIYLHIITRELRGDSMNVIISFT